MSGDVRPSVLATACVAVIVSVTVAGMRAQGPAGRAPVSFNREILPILSNNCFACHGPDEKAAEDTIPLRHRGRRVHQGRRHRARQRRGQPARRAHHQHRSRSKRMPPPESGRTPDGRSRSICCKRWIDAGREVGHALGLRAAEAARIRRPTTRAGWARNPIDQFILARLEREGLKPSPEADKETLLRRVTYDLTGLPPDAGGGRRLPGRHVARRLREARRRAPAVAALRRADGDAVARRRALCRHARLPHRQPVARCGRGATG